MKVFNIVAFDEEVYNEMVGRRVSGTIGYDEKGQVTFNMHHRAPRRVRPIAKELNTAHARATVYKSEGTKVVIQVNAGELPYAPDIIRREAAEVAAALERNNWRPIGAEW